jgi:hypothetical protein
MHFNALAVSFPATQPIVGCHQSSRLLHCRQQCACLLSTAAAAGAGGGVNLTKLAAKHSMPCVIASSVETMAISLLLLLLLIPLILLRAQLTG